MKTSQVVALFTTLLLALSGFAVASFLYLGSRDQTAEAKIEDLQGNLHRIERILTELTTAQSNSANTIEALTIQVADPESRVTEIEDPSYSTTALFAGS